MWWWRWRGWRGWSWIVQLVEVHRLTGRGGRFFRNCGSRALSRRFRVSVCGGPGPLLCAASMMIQLAALTSIEDFVDQAAIVSLLERFEETQDLCIYGRGGGYSRDAQSGGVLVRELRVTGTGTMSVILLTINGCLCPCHR